VIWQSQISLQILHKLQQMNDDPLWDEDPDFLIWLIYIGGAFAPTGSARSDYILLLRRKYTSRFEDLYSSWSVLEEGMKEFIWSEKAFSSQAKSFWEETCM
jgi:hypothetical protein